MKVLLYSEALNLIKKSGIGKTISHQRQALEKNGVAYTIDPKDDYNIIHINTVGPNSYRLSKMAKSEGKKVVYHAHSTEEDFRNSFLFSNFISPYFKKWLIKCYTSGDCIITPTPYSKQLLEGYGIKNRIYDVSNGIDTDFFARNENYRSQFRKAFGYSESDKIIMSVGLYIERKGIIDFVELAKRLPQYKFIWFGHTNLSTVPAKVGKAIKTKLPNLVFPGYVESKILRTAYSGTDLFLFPTYEETEGIVLLEALASKSDVLIRDIPIYSNFKDKDNIYKACTMLEFQRCICGILEGQLPSLAEKGYLIAQERSLEKTGAKLKEIYEGLLDGCLPE